MGEYSKVLTRPEARHRYWHIHKTDREFFPETGEVFVVEFGGVRHELKVNHKGDIMTGKLYARHRFFEGSRITLSSSGSGQYIMEAPDAVPDG